MMLSMKIRSASKVRRILLIGAVSFLFLGLSIYLDYYNLMEADFLATNLSFENPNQEDLQGSHKNSLHLVGSAILFVMPLVNLFENLPHLFFLPSPLERQNSPLLC
jgi:hypothetical protein